PRIADLIISGTGTRAYERVSAEIDARARRRRASGGAPPGTAPDDDGHDGGGLAPPLGAAGPAAAARPGLVLWRRRRMAAARRDADGLLLPRTVFATASRAGEDRLREQASREVLAFGELLDDSDVPASDERARALMTRALDAYQAAGKTL